MRARLIYHRKVVLTHGKSNDVAVAELKVWAVSLSEAYPGGFRFSAFLVSKVTGRIIFGIDNHRPKGPHLHELDGSEQPYMFVDEATLVADFWKRVEKEGYET